MALGKHFEALSLTDEEEKAIKEELIMAKKYENEINEKVTKKIENEELKKLLMEHDDHRGSSSKMQAYYNKLHQLQIQAESKLKKQIREAEDYEITKLQDDQQRLLENETAKLLEGRQLFQQSEEKRKELERIELDKREKWKAQEDNRIFEPKASPKKKDLITLLQSNSQQSKYQTVLLFNTKQRE